MIRAGSRSAMGGARAAGPAPPWAKARQGLQGRVRDLEGRALLRLGSPVELLLTSAVRRLARRRPDVFERLGGFRQATFLVAPDELPVCFLLAPCGADGYVRVVKAEHAGNPAVRIAGPLTVLLRLFDGSGDADSAFFSRRVRIDGDTEAAMALHNALEAAELDLPDLAGFAAPAIRRFLLSWTRRRRVAGRGN